MAAYERVTLNRGGLNSRFDCIFSAVNLGAVLTLCMLFVVC